MPGHNQRSRNYRGNLLKDGAHKGDGCVDGEFRKNDSVVDGWMDGWMND